jgi:hypothetical protein
MSKSGALAMRAAATLAQVAEEGIEKASTRAHEERVAKKVEQAKRHIVQLLLPIVGPVAEEPFVLEDFADLYDNDGRVCVRIDGLLFNYLAATARRPACVCIVDGRCTDCGKRPRLMEVHDLADIGALFTKPGRKAREEFRCYVCRERDKR